MSQTATPTTPIALQTRAIEPGALVRVIAQSDVICVGLYEPPGAHGPGDWLVVVLERPSQYSRWTLTWGGEAHRAMRLATRLSEAAGVIGQMSGG